MEIDDIIDVLCDGTKEEIEKIIKDEKISYSFSECGEYTIMFSLKNEIDRGYGIYNPNCVNFFGNEFSYERI